MRHAWAGLAVLGAVTLAAADEPKKAAPPRPAAALSPAELFQRYDADKNGQLSPEEFARLVTDLRRPPLPDGVKAYRDLAYGPHPERNTLDVYVPRGDKPLPLIVWVHGGAWYAGSKDGLHPGLTAMLGRGFAVASVNYRLSQHAVFPAQIEDCKAAVRYLRANAKKYGYDAERVGVWGGSAGGHLVALLGTTGGDKDLEGGVGGNAGVSSRVQAVLNWYGPTDLRNVDPAAANGAVPKLLGGPPAEKAELARQASPVAHATPDDAPSLAVFGAKDELVPPHHARHLDEALKKVGVESAVIVLDGAGHGGPAFVSPAMLDRAEAFFRKHLAAPKE